MSPFIPTKTRDRFLTDGMILTHSKQKPDDFDVYDDEIITNPFTKIRDSIAMKHDAQTNQRPDVTGDYLWNPLLAPLNIKSMAKSTGRKSGIYYRPISQKYIPANMRHRASCKASPSHQSQADYHSFISTDKLFDPSSSYYSHESKSPYALTNGGNKPWLTDSNKYLLALQQEADGNGSQNIPPAFNSMFVQLDEMLDTYKQMDQKKLEYEHDLLESERNSWPQKMKSSVNIMDVVQQLDLQILTGHTVVCTWPNEENFTGKLFNIHDLLRDDDLSHS
jgi:hypothetical protein